MIKTLDLQRNVTAYLENAYGIGYEKTNNSIWQASFSMPLNDPKVDKIKLLKYVEITDGDEYIGLFRIIPKNTIKNESTEEITYQCEHVLATLLGSTLFKYHQLSNYITSEVLQYLIDQQKEKHWEIGVVEFTRSFHYSWENENVLAAIFSIPKPFNEQYRWTWDTTSYPWRLNLVRPETEPTVRIKDKHNLKGLEIEENPMSMFNRIYPLGNGEGVNQLGIESVNNGVPYIEDAESIAENGIMETTWVDTRFENPATLMASGEAILKKWKEPIVTWKASAADVSKITGAEIDKLKEGRVLRIDVEGFPVTDLRIMKESKPDIKGDPGNVQLEIGNVSEDLSATQADLERRQQVNELSSHGSTNIMTLPYVDNCDPQHPMIIRVPIWEDVVNINTFSLTYETQAFRAYSQAIEGGGAISKTTEGGGSHIESNTTNSGGSIVKASTTKGGGSVVQSNTTNSGGATVQSTDSNGTHRHKMFSYYTDTGSDVPPDNFLNYLAVANNAGTAVSGFFAPGYPSDLYTEEATGSHSHGVTIPNHTHPFSINLPNHTHPFSVDLPNHTHPFSFNIPNHTHPFTLPSHIHGIKYGIFNNPNNATELIIKVNGITVPINSTSGTDIDLTPYLPKDSDGKIQRGQWIEIEITPNDLARINATLTSRLFIQSRIGSTF